ncbi:hypothetical protein YC2023_110357 [Brassica napus]
MLATLLNTYTRCYQKINKAEAIFEKMGELGVLSKLFLLKLMGFDPKIRISGGAESGSDIDTETTPEPRANRTIQPTEGPTKIYVQSKRRIYATRRSLETQIERVNQHPRIERIGLKGTASQPSSPSFHPVFILTDKIDPSPIQSIDPAFVPATGSE